MPDITITFEDGTNHVYNNVPMSVTPDQIEERASSDFSGNVIGNAIEKDPTIITEISAAIHNSSTKA